MSWKPDAGLVETALAAGFVVQPEPPRYWIVDRDGQEVAEADGIDNARFAIETLTTEGHGALEIHDGRGIVAYGERVDGVMVWAEFFERAA